MDKIIEPVGDKVLIAQDKGDEKTHSGLYLPQGIQEKDMAQLGRIIKVGPGYPVPDPGSIEQEPWSKTSKNKYFPLQVKEGDQCIFLKNQGVEINFEGKKYIVVPQSAILILLRDNFAE